MANLSSAAILEQVRGAMLRLDGTKPADQVLLDAFIERRSEEAFAALVRRHGPMVLGVCHRVIGDRHEAEDAFQATFLVLARKAKSVIPRERVGNWLYGVAYNTAIKARAMHAKRRGREQLRGTLPEREAAPTKSWDDLQPMLDQEVSRLPDKYRAPIVLVDLEGKTRQEAASQLGWPEGSVSSRLSRARELLARRLTRRGVSLTSGAFVAVLSTNGMSAAVPTSLMVSTIKAADIVAAGMATTGLISTPIVALTESVVKAMFVTKVKIAVLVCVGLGLTVGLTGLGMRSIFGSALAGQQPQAISQEEKKAKEVDGLNVKVDEKERKENAESEAKIRHLLEERLKTAQMSVDLMNRQFAAGAASTEDMQRVNLRFHRAELDLCETDKERITIHEKIVKLFQDQEQRILAMNKAGTVSQAEVIEVKMNRLEAEIALERAKAGKSGK